jgi:hypothetical protein
MALLEQKTIFIQINRQPSGTASNPHLVLFSAF